MLSQRATIARASSAVTSDAPSVSTLAPLCSREYRAIVSVVAIAALIPRTLLAAIADPMPAPSITMPASASPRETARPTGCRDVRVIDRVGRCPCHDRRPPGRDRAASAIRSRRSVMPVWSLAMATRPDIGRRSEPELVWRRAALADDRDPALAQRVERERRDVSAPRQQHRLAALQDAGVGLGDDVEGFHCGIIPADG